MTSLVTRWATIWVLTYYYNLFSSRSPRFCPALTWLLQPHTVSSFLVWNSDISKLNLNFPEKQFNVEQNESCYWFSLLFLAAATMGRCHWISFATNSDNSFGQVIFLSVICQSCLFFIENVLFWFLYTWFLAYVTPFSCFRPSSPKRSRLCLVSWAVRRRSYAQQPGTSDRHPLDALLWLSVRA